MADTGSGFSTWGAPVEEPLMSDEEFLKAIELDYGKRGLEAAKRRLAFFKSTIGIPGDKAQVAAKASMMESFLMQAVDGNFD